MGRLKLKDLYIGKTDGYNEFLEYKLIGDKKVEIFKNILC